MSLDNVSSPNGIEWKREEPYATNFIDVDNDDSPRAWLPLTSRE